VVGSLLKSAAAGHPVEGLATRLPRSLDSIPGYTVDTGAVRIGELARQAQVSVQAIRLYEKEGLLAPAGRTAAGYREFDPDAVGVLRAIKRSQGLGFRPHEIAQLIRLHGASGDANRHHPQSSAQLIAAVDLVQANLVELKSRIASLEGAKRDLNQLMRSMRRPSGSVCPVTVRQRRRAESRSAGAEDPLSAARS